MQNLPERYTFWPQNKINFGELEKNKKVFAEERISVDDEIVGEETEKLDISNPTFTNKSSINFLTDIKSEPIQLTPDTDSQTSDGPTGTIKAGIGNNMETSIDNIEHFFGQLAKNENTNVNPDNVLLSDLKQQKFTKNSSLEVTEPTSFSIISAKTVESTSQINNNEDSLRIENFFGQLADASNFSLVQSNAGSDATNDTAQISPSETPQIIYNGNETNETNPIIIDIQNISDDNSTLEDKTEIYLGVPRLNISNAPSDVGIIADITSEITEEYEMTANKSAQQQTMKVMDATSLNLTDHSQTDPEPGIYVRTSEKPTEKNDLQEKEEIISTIKELTEETTTFTIADHLQEAETNNTDFIDDSKDNNKVDSNEDNDDDQDGKASVSDDKLTTEPPQEITTRRLPARYVSSKTRSKPKVTTKPTPKVINHNMNLQTALIINTLSKVREVTGGCMLCVTE